MVIFPPFHYIMLNIVEKFRIRIWYSIYGSGYDTVYYGAGYDLPFNLFLTIYGYISSVPLYNVKYHRKNSDPDMVQYMWIQI